MNLLFLLAGLLSVAGALGVILAKQPIHQVLATVLNFIGLAVLFISLDAEFMGVIQLIVYGGAVMVLFLFVIALLSAGKDPVERDLGTMSAQQIAGYSIGGGVLLMLGLVAVVGKGSTTEFATKLQEYNGHGFGTVHTFGWELLTTHVLPFQVLAFILMVAVVGVVILVGRQKA